MNAEQYVAQFSGPSLDGVIANCRANLAKPNEVYPNGRWSHDVERETLGYAMERQWELRLAGYFRADGSFAGYADED